MNEKELVGMTLGNSTLERVIGKGGMAIVFLAQQARPARTVAVKVLLPTSVQNDLDEQRVFLERFRREADTVAKLEHKNILSIYEYEEAMIKGQHLAYLVMPYIRGGTLRQRIDEMRRSGQKFDLATVSDYINQVADALSYAHSLGVIHRDIKPGNLLFHSDGRLLLTDFGIARMNAMPSLTMVGSFIGTVEYASPEQVNSTEVDSRSDIYSLGVILYELLTGTVPFTGPTPFVVMSKLLHDPVPPIRSVRADLSPAIESVVQKALAKDPRARYQKVTDLATELAAAVAVPIGLHLGGYNNNADLTIAEGSWQPPVSSGRGITTPMPRFPSDAVVAQATPFTPALSAQTPLNVTQVAPGWQVQQYAPATKEEAESDQAKTYRPGRRILFYVIALISLVAEVLVLGLTLGARKELPSVVLGVLLGNAINLLSLAAISFTSVVRQKNHFGIFNRVIWVQVVTLILSGFFISYGSSSGKPSLYLPLASFAILVVTNIYSVYGLGQVDAAHEQVEVAPIQWRAALVGALTGLLPLTIILVFAMAVLLSSISGSSLMLPLLGIMLIAFIGSPTPGSMMAVWLSQKMSFPILVRTSAMAGLFMFVIAYTLVAGGGWLLHGRSLFSEQFPQSGLLATLIMGVLLGLVGFLRGILDAWVYHRVMLRRS